MADTQALAEVLGAGKLHTRDLPMEALSIVTSLFSLRTIEALALSMSPSQTYPEPSAAVHGW